VAVTPGPVGPVFWPRPSPRPAIPYNRTRGAIDLSLDLHPRSQSARLTARLGMDTMRALDRSIAPVVVARDPNAIASCCRTHAFVSRFHGTPAPRSGGEARPLSFGSVGKVAMQACLAAGTGLTLGARPLAGDACAHTGRRDVGLGRRLAGAAATAREVGEVE
jgi:hypothetical protein